MYVSANNGTSWTAVNTGLTYTNIDALAPDVSGNLFAGTEGGGVWRRPLSEMITPVIALSVDSVNIYVNDSVLVPVRVTFPSYKSYSSAELNFQHAGLTFIGVDTSNSLMNGKGWQIQYNDTSSFLITASAGAQDISESGVLFNLKFAAIGSPCAFVPITVTKAVFNTGVDSVVTRNGGVNIKAIPIPHYGDVDGNGLIQAYDASLVLKHVAFVDTLGCQALANANVSCDTTVSAYDATLILERVVGLIDTLPFCTSVQASGNISMNNIITHPGDTIDVPLNLSNGNNILSFEGMLTYNPTHMTFSNVVWSQLLDAFMKEVHVGNGEIHFAAAGSLPDGHEGIFATMQFVKARDGQSVVALKRLRWNEGPVMQNVDSASIVTGVKEIRNQIPKAFALEQNYPNPFNPATSIRFALPKSSYVSLKIFNLLGQEVASLVNGELPAGYREVAWDAGSAGGGMPSGMYFYRLQARPIDGERAGSFVETKKLLLMK